MNIVATNRKAYRDYDIFEEFDAGLVLKGCEVKSLRHGGIMLSDGYGQVKDGEVFLFNVHISPYKEGSIYNPDPKRVRKLLLKKSEISKLYGKAQQKGYTIVPLKVYFSDRGQAKIVIGLARGRRAYDKKQKILKAEMKRELLRTKKVVR
jgi:SsrA-binding protein